MKQTKRIAMLLVILLSVSFAGASFAAEATLPVAQAVVEQTAFSMEPTPTIFATFAPTLAPAAELAATEAPAATDEPIVSSEPAASEQPAITQTPAASASPATEAPASETPAATETSAETATPAPTESSLDETATPAPTESSLDETATEEPTATPVIRSVDIRMDMPANLQMGDTVTLSAALTGYDDVNVALQWQYTRDGEHWYDADGATNLTYSFTVNDDTAGTGWRLAVSIL